MSETRRTSGRGATIELENLTKRYPGSSGPSVDNVSMEIRAGETVVFVGPSGCGKSTTLKMINRLIEPSGGRIRIGGEDVTDMDPVRLRRRIGYAIQSSGLFPHMTVAQNIALVPRMTGWPAGRITARVEEMLDLVGLDPGEFHDRHPRQLSGGQQQRVGVARALAADPPVLLMDEPFGAVDPITREHLQDELIRLQHELRTTIVFVTHDFDEAIKLGDRIAVLRERSHIAQFDTPEAILTNPADDFVSGFVGAGAGTALKRLNLTRVRNVEVTDCPTATVDDPLQEIFNKLRSSSTNGILLLDRRRRPYKWLRRGDLMRARGSLARAGTPVSDTATRDATLRDARTPGGRPAGGGSGAARTGGGADGPDACRAGGGQRGRGGAGVTTTRVDLYGDADTKAGTGTDETSAPVPKSRTSRLSWQRMTLLPGALLLVLLVTWLWFRQADLDAISENALSNGQVSKALRQHVELTVISTFFVLVIAIPLGILLTRRAFRRATPVVMTVANMGRATPAIGLLALLVIWLGIGRKAALIGMVAYAVLPVLSNTIAALKANDPTLLEVARGIGMSSPGVLARVELPLAVPLILAGVRTALVLNVGTATLAAFGEEVDWGC